MKKIIILLFVFVLCFSAFATQVYSFSVKPYGFQRVSGSDEYTDSVYGVGESLSYENFYYKDFWSFGFEFSVDSFILPEKSNLTDLQLFAMLGLKKNMKDGFRIFSYIKYGVFAQLFSEAVSYNQKFGIEVGLGKSINDNVFVFCSAEGLFALPKVGEVQYRNATLDTNIGVEYSF